MDPTHRMTTQSDNPRPFESEWSDRVEADRVWAPDAEPGLRFTPIDDEPAASSPPPPWAWSVPEPEPPAKKANRKVMFVASCLAVALLGAAVGAAFGARQHNGLRPAAVDQPFTRPTTPANPSNPSLPLTPSNPTPNPTTPASPSSPGNSGPAAADASRGVVDITTTLAGGGQAAGTGMLLTATGEVLTNNHVIAGSTSISVQVAGTGPTYTGTVVGTDATDDVAVVQLSKASGLPTVKTGSSSSVAVGDTVTAVGNALGQGGAPAVTTGAVTAVGQSITVSDDLTGADRQLTDLIQINAPLQPGDSGGPLLNSSSEVIGMDTAASAGRRFRNAGSQEGFAIPITKALSIASQIVAGKGSATIQIGPPAYLGVELATENSPTGRSAGASGAAVGGVASGMPAEKAGIKAGDTITSIAGQSVGSASSLEAALATHKPGDKVVVGWTDSSGQRHTAMVQLASGPPK